MEIDVSTLAPGAAYRWMIACVVPRPIAWVSTLSVAGVPNLAPFSFFGGVTSDPPIVMVSVGRRRDGSRKDTATNLLATREAVVHVPDRERASAMVATSADVAPDVDEFELAGLATLAAVQVRPPRIADAPIAMECSLERHEELGRGPVDLFLLRILRFHVADALLVDGLPDAARLRAVGRLGREDYCDTSATFRIPRPGR
ncbi:MAG: flavin reductase family protein [Planctomycetota bacterium]|nr:flavin reductase family protein [Planctomycetota bacterium]